jgi:large subunit ribosomal protein L25
MVQVDISVLTTGDPQTGTVVTVGLQSITVSADAMNLPESVHVDVTDAEPGFHLLAGQLELPAGVVLITDPDLVAVAVTETHLAEEVEAAELEVGAGAGHRCRRGRGGGRRGRRGRRRRRRRPRRGCLRRGPASDES